MASGSQVPRTDAARAPLSKFGGSRLVGQVTALEESGHRRDLKEERIVILSRDAMAMRVRLERQVGAVPMQVAAGVRADGPNVVWGLVSLLRQSMATRMGCVASL